MNSSICSWGRRPLQTPCLLLLAGKAPYAYSSSPLMVRPKLVTVRAHEYNFTAWGNHPLGCEVKSKAPGLLRDSKHSGMAAPRCGTEPKTETRRCYKALPMFIGEDKLYPGLWRTKALL